MNRRFNLASWIALATVLVLSTFAAGNALAASSTAAARVQFVVGNVSATAPDGTRRQLNKGDRLFEGDTVQSGDNGAAQIIYRDRSRMAVRVNTQFKIEVFNYDNNDGSGGASVFSLLSGALRAVSGLIGKASRENVTINTPLATIGIRGTDHEVVHIDPDINRNIAKPGTYNKVYLGGTEIRTRDAKIDINLRQTGFVGGTPGNVSKPVQIPDLPQAIKSQIIEKVPVQARRTVPNQPESGATARTRTQPGTATSAKQGSANPEPAAATGLRSVTPTIGNITNKALTPGTGQTLAPATKALIPSTGTVLQKGGGLSVPSTTLEKTLSTSPTNLLNQTLTAPALKVDPGVKSVIPTEGISRPAATLPSVGITTPKIEPAIKQPINIEPVIKQPVITQPIVKQPVVTQPVVKEPVLTQPVISEPIKSINTQGLTLPGTTTIRK